MTNPSIEFSSLIYGSLVNTLLESSGDVEEVNNKLLDIGFRVGLRLAHEFARDRSLDRIDSPNKVIEDIIVKNWRNITGKSPEFSPIKDSESNKKFELTFDQSIFTQNVNIPERYSGLRYASLLPGVIRGIFEIFHYEVNAYLKDTPPQQQKPCTKVIVEIVKEIPIAVPKDDN